LKPGKPITVKVMVKGQSAVSTRPCPNEATTDANPDMHRSRASRFRGAATVLALSGREGC